MIGKNELQILYHKGHFQRLTIHLFWFTYKYCLTFPLQNNLLKKTMAVALGIVVNQKQ
jgi:hypothetical protein